VRLRTARARNCFSAEAVVTMAFQLCRCAERRWIRIHKYEILSKLIAGARFIDGIEAERIAA
jgi:hypothetical protein